MHTIRVTQGTPRGGSMLVPHRIPPGESPTAAALWFSTGTSWNSDQCLTSLRQGPGQGPRRNPRPIVGQVKAWARGHQTLMPRLTDVRTAETHLRSCDPVVTRGDDGGNP